MCLLPFCRHFLKTYCELSPTHFSPSTTEVFLNLSGYTCPTLPVSVLSHFLYLSLLSHVPLSLSSLSVSLSSVLFPFCFSHSLYLSTCSHPHPSRPCLFLQAWSFPGHKFLSLQPYGSIIVSLGLAGLPWVSYSSQCFFLCLLFPHCLCHPLSKTLLFWLLGICYLQSLSLTLCLACPPSVSLLLSWCLQVTLHTSLPFSLFSPPRLSPWEPSPPTETVPGQLCPKSVVSQSSHPR